MTTLVDRIERALLALSIVSGFATLLIILIVTLDVAGRFLFNTPFDGGVEASELLMVVLVFFGLAAAQQQRQNYAIELFVRHLPVAGQRIFELFGYVVGLVIVVLLAWPSSKQALSSFERGEAGFGVLPFPLWPARILLAAGLWLLAVQFLCDLYRFFTDRSPPAEPVDAPKVFE